MMIAKRSFFTVFIFIGFIGFVFGQAVTFHSPVPWITLRENKIIAKMLVDTAEVKDNTVYLILSKVEQGKEVKLATKKFKAVDYSHEYKLYDVDARILGGKDYLKIDWKISGTDKKGTLNPFGIVKLDSDDPKNSAIQCKKFSGKLEAGTVKSTLKEKDFIKIGSSMLCPLWDTNMLSLVCKKLKGIESISFTFDGKNGKNAFLSFPDRKIIYYPGNDSLSAVYYKRSVTDTGIQYDAKEWIQEIKKEVKEDIVVITVPWYDLGLLALDGRIFGFSVFTVKSENESIALPETAQIEIPGTWGNMILVKE